MSKGYIINRKKAKSGDKNIKKDFNAFDKKVKDINKNPHLYDWKGDKK